MKKSLYISLLILLYFLQNSCKKDLPVDPNNSGNNGGGQTTDTIYFSVDGISVSLRQPRVIRAEFAIMEDDFKSISQSKPITQFGYCWSSSESMPNKNNAQFSQLGAKTTKGVFADTLLPLQPNTKYWYTLYFESNGQVTYHPLVKSFATTSPETPIILTLDTINASPISNITQTSATVFGRIDYAGTNGIKKYGHCWGLEKKPVLNGAGTNSSLYNGNVTVATGFVSNINNLTLNTTYHIRAYAVSTTNEVFYGDDAMFTTNNITVVAPIVITQPATDITTTTAKLNGKISSTGGGNITESGFVYSSNPNPTVQTASKIDLGAQSGAVPLEYAWNGLTPATSYFVRAFAKNNEGYGYGGNIVVTTLTPNTNPPTVINGQVTNITTTNASVSGQATEEGGASIIDYGFVWSKTTQEPTVTNNSGIQKVLGTPGTSVFMQQLTTLEPSTSYWIRAFAKNGVNSNYSYGNPALQFQTVTPNTSCPTVQNGVVANILTTTASITGKVTDPGGSAVTTYGHVWSKTSQQPTFVSNDGKTNFNGTPGTSDYTSNMAGLTANTTYWVRAYAKNSINSNYCYGDPAVQLITFCNPGVTMGGVSNIMQTFATASGNIDCIGSAGSVAQHGHCWSTSQSPTLNNSKTSLGSSPSVGGFTSNLTGLTAGTTYYVRSYITTGGNTYYSNGSGTSFTATANTDPPTVTTGTPTGVQANQFIANGQVSTIGCSSISEYGFCYSTLISNPTINDSKEVVGTSANQAINFSKEFQCIDANTTFYVRAYAINNCGINYGLPQTITTLNGFAVPCGRVLHFTFDNQSTKEEVTGNSGSLTGAPVYSTDRPNNSGYSLSLDGVDDYMDFLGNFSVNPMTISFWIKTNDTYGGIMVGTSGTHITNSYLYGPYDNANFGDITASVLDNNWKHIVVTKSGFVCNLYINGGNPITVSGNSNAFSCNNCNIRFGRFTSNGGPKYLLGKLDNFRIYNRALTITEVQKLFQAKQ